MNLLYFLFKIIKFLLLFILLIIKAEMSAKLNSIKDEPINLLVEKNRTSPKKT